MKKINKVTYFLTSILFFVIFDLYFSNLLVKNLNVLPTNPILDLLYIENSGAAFSILQNSRIFLICFSIFALVWILYYAIQSIKKASIFALFWVAMLTAGIFCNAYERIIFGYVRDFFKLNFVNFPVFNISDIFINVSVIMIVIIILKHNFAKNNEDSNR